MSDVILEIKNIEKSFDQNKVHKGVSFNLHKGECLGLLGGSGTGKSVLLRSIIGLEFVDKGEIIYKGKNLENLKEQEILKIRTEISYSFQSGALFDSVNVFENLAFPLYEHTSLNHQEIRSKVSKMLEMIDLQGRELLMPSDLSGGMQKRVGMARAMILNPEIVLYDEPTAGLDPANTLNVVEVMRRFCTDGRSSIFVTHDIPAALNLCNRIVIIGEGKIFFEGTVDEFRNSKDERVLKFSANPHS